MFRYPAAVACAAAIAALAACSDRSLFPASPTPLSLSRAGAGSSAASHGAIGGADYHEPYPAPPPPDPGMPPTDPTAPAPAPPTVPPAAFVISPDSGPMAGGTPITISGMNVLQGATLVFGLVPATGVVIVEGVSMTARTPPGAAGAVDVTVTNPDGHAYMLAGGFTYVAEPELGMPATITITPQGVTPLGVTPEGVTPKAIQIPVGSRVTFVNNGSRDREMRSGPHPLHTDCPEINELGVISPGASAQTGVLLIARTCTFHDHSDPENAAVMGRIVIKQVSPLP